MKNKKKIFLLYLVTTILAITAVFCILLLWDIFKQSDKRVIFTLLSDAFFITGFIFAGLGSLILIGSTGFFDMLAYGFKTIGTVFLFPLVFSKKKYEKYYDFVERRREIRQMRKETSTTLYALVVGIVFILIAAFFLIFIYN